MHRTGLGASEVLICSLPPDLGTGGHGRLRNQLLDFCLAIEGFGPGAEAGQSCQAAGLRGRIRWSMWYRWVAYCSVQAEALTFPVGVENLKGC